MPEKGFLDEMRSRGKAWEQVDRRRVLRRIGEPCGPGGTTKKAIVFICHVFPPEPAPGGIMVAELAGHLASRGHAVTVVTGWPNHPGGVLYPGWKRRWRFAEAGPSGIRIVRCNHSVHPRGEWAWRLWYYLSFGLSAAFGGLWESRPDVVVSLSTPIFGSLAAWILARIKGARFVYAVFDLHPEAALNAGKIRVGLAYRVLRALDSALCRRSDVVITLTDGLRSEIVARRVDPGMVHVGPLWLDGDRIRPGARDNSWRRSKGIPPETCVALFAGTVGYSSGAEILIEVAALLSKRNDISILCVGDGPVKEEMMEAAAGRHLENLRFLPFQPESELEDMQAAADIGLVTLLPDAGRTSMPSKVIAYMAAGRPVLASVAPDCDAAKLLQDSECGVVVPCRDAVALARAIEELAGDSARRLEMGRRGRAVFERRFERSVGVARYEELILRSLETNPTRILMQPVDHIDARPLE